MDGWLGVRNCGGRRRTRFNTMTTRQHCQEKQQPHTGDSRNKWSAFVTSTSMGGHAGRLELSSKPSISAAIVLRLCSEGLTGSSTPHMHRAECPLSCANRPRKLSQLSWWPEWLVYGFESKAKRNTTWPRQECLRFVWDGPSWLRWLGPHRRWLAGRIDMSPLYVVVAKDLGLGVLSGRCQSEHSHWSRHWTKPRRPVRPAPSRAAETNVGLIGVLDTGRVNHCLRQDAQVGQHKHSLSI